MSNDALDFLMGAGVPGAKFDEVGQVHKGRIRNFEKVQQRDFDTGKPKFWDDGNPMYQLVFTIETDETDPEIEDDDGVRKLYARGQMRDAIAKAVRATGHRGNLVGGTLAVKFAKEEPNSRGRGKNKKVYAARFEPPAETDFVEDDSDDFDPPANGEWDEEPF